MSHQPLQLPITPSSPSLHSHLAALDVLSLRLQTLTTKTSHPARIPLTSKASLNAEVVHTNDIKVHVGGEWWIGMTAGEAAEYVVRRKAALLEEHARIAEGHKRPAAVERLLGSAPAPEPALASSPGTAEQKQKSKFLSPAISFHPLFHHPAAAGPSRSQPTQTEQPAAPVVKVLSASSEGDPGSASVSTKSTATLVDVLDDEGPVGERGQPQGDDPTLNEEGLPFHEIRETVDGRPLGPMPAISGSAAQSASIRDVEEEDDYWSEEAQARRTELRRRVFHEGSDTDDDIIEDEGEFKEPSESSPPSAASTEEPPAKPAAQSTSSPDLPHRASSNSTQQPRSILKAPTRKKSVSFDPSVPEPAAEPAAPAAIAAQKFGFPLPLSSEDDYGDEFAPKPVPIIPTPQPPNRAATSASASASVVAGKVEGRGFAGFKRGFLSSPASSSAATTAKLSPVPAASAPPESTATTSAPTSKPPVERHVSFTEDTAPPAPDAPEPKKKTSLFAQRLAGKEIDASAPYATGATGRYPVLPKMSENKPMVALKSSVIEKAPTAAVPTPSTASTSSSGSSRDLPPVLATRSQDHEDEQDEQEGEDDDDEMDLGDYSSGEEDEYDLDEALLAREVALEYHRRHAYKPLNRDPSDPASDDLGPDDYAYDPRILDSVMLGLPRISEVDEDLGQGPGAEGGRGPTIINPTPEDLRRFVRVGKLENGNLVLAPGEAAFDPSDEEEAEDEDEDEHGASKERRREIRNRREEIKRQLLGLPPAHTQVIPSGREDKAKAVQEEEWRASMPPSLSVVSSPPRPENNAPVDQDPEERGVPAVPAVGHAQSKVNAVKVVAPAVRERKREAEPPTNTNTGTNSGRVDAQAQAHAQATAGSRSTEPEPEPEPVKPKKVSRFKAARMGL